MNARSKQISRLKTDKKARWAYIKAKLGVLVPSQIRALRLKSDMPRQMDLATEAAMQQSRISMLEAPGAANVTLETLAWLAAIFNVGLLVKFVPFSEMLHWENSFSQDGFNVVRLDEDKAFLSPTIQPQPVYADLKHGLLVSQLGEISTLSVQEQEKNTWGMDFNHGLRTPSCSDQRNYLPSMSALIR